MEAAGLHYDFVQDNHSMSAKVGTLRGLHFQSPPAAQDKLVRCGRGAFFDVAVDIRDGSPTYGKWVGEELTFENGKQLLVPAGFLHGFVTRAPDTEIVYKCSDYYNLEADGAVLWNDPDIGIDWGLGDVAPLLSGKRRQGTAFARIRHAIHLRGLTHETSRYRRRGFIGSAVVRQAITAGHSVVNVDALTYAACLDNVASVSSSPNYAFEQADIRDRAALDRVLCHA